MRVAGHAQVTGLLTAYVDGALPASERLAVERHLASCPACRHDHGELSALAGVIQGLPLASAPAFATFWARLEPQLNRRGWWPQLQAPRRWALAPVLAVALLVLGAAGSAYASERALPGSPLFPVKLLREDVELHLASSPQQRNQLILHFASARLGEAEALNRQGKDDLAVQSLERFRSLLARVEAPASHRRTPPEMRDEPSLESFESELGRIDQVTTSPEVREALDKARDDVRRDEREKPKDGARDRESPDHPEEPPKSQGD